MSQRSTRHLIALAVALAGIVVSVLMLRVEVQLEQDASYVSWCNVTEQVNCDAVLGSRWSRLLDLPLPIWAMALFGIGAAAAVPGAVLGSLGGLADIVLLGLAGGAVGFALVLLWIASVLIGVLCPLCLTLDAIIVAWAIVIAPLARGLRTPRTGWLALATAFVVALVGGGLWANATPATAVTVAEIQERHPDFVAYWNARPAGAGADLDGRWQKGPADAAVTIVEFSDFECPACLQAFRDLRDVVQTRRDVRVVFRHYPLDPRCNDDVPGGRHHNACLAAFAAECAGDQGKFWPYHDRLFENQQTLDRDNLFRFAREFALDIDAFRTCLDAPATVERVRRDVEIGTRLAIASTPTLFINGRRVDGALDRPYYDFAIALEKERGPAS